MQPKFKIGDIVFALAEGFNPFQPREITQIRRATKYKEIFYDCAPKSNIFYGGGAVFSEKELYSKSEIKIEINKIYDKVLISMLARPMGR